MIGTPLDDRTSGGRSVRPCVRRTCRRSESTICVTPAPRCFSCREFTQGRDGDARHSQISLTLDACSHVVPALQQEAARQIAKAVCCGRAALCVVLDAPELWEIAAGTLLVSTGAVGHRTRDVVTSSGVLPGTCRPLPSPTWYVSSRRRGVGGGTRR